METTWTAFRFCSTRLLCFLLLLRKCEGESGSIGTDFLLAVVDPGGLYTEAQLNPAPVVTTAAPVVTTAAAVVTTAAPTNNATTAGSGQGQSSSSNLTSTAANQAANGQSATSMASQVTSQSNSGTSTAMETTSMAVSETTGATTAASGSKRKKRAVSDSTGLELHIVTSSTSTVEVNVTSPLQSGLQARRIQLTKNDVKVVQLSLDFCSSAGITNKGIRITASQKVSIHVFAWSPGVAFSFIALPTNRLGKQYYSMSYSSTGNVAKYVEPPTTTGAPTVAATTQGSAQAATTAQAGMTSQGSNQANAVTSQPSTQAVAMTSQGATQSNGMTSQSTNGIPTTTNNNPTTTANNNNPTTTTAPSAPVTTSAAAVVNAGSSTAASNVATSAAMAPTSTAAPLVQTTATSGSGSGQPLTEPYACHFVLITAAETATSVQVQSPSGVRCLHSGSVAASSFTFALNAWQTNLLTCFDDVTGIKITSTKPVATYVGKRKTGQCTSEAVVEQMLPKEVLGRKYFIPGAGLMKTVRILGSTNAVLQVSVGSSSQTINLPAGRYTELATTVSDISINATAQVYVMAAISPTTVNADFALMTIVPLGQYTPEGQFGLTSRQTGSPNSASVIYTSSNTGGFQLNGAAPSWSWSGTTYKYYSHSTPSGVHVMKQTTTTNVVTAYANGRVSTGMWANPVAFRTAPLWESCTATAATSGDNLDNDCDGKIDEEQTNGKDDDGDGKVDEDTINDGSTTNTEETSKKKNKSLMMMIILGVILGGIPLVIITYLIVRALFCPTKEMTTEESQVEIIGTEQQVTNSDHDGTMTPVQ